MDFLTKHFILFNPLFKDYNDFKELIKEKEIKKSINQDNISNFLLFLKLKLTHKDFFFIIKDKNTLNVIGIILASSFFNDKYISINIKIKKECRNNHVIREIYFGFTREIMKHFKFKKIIFNVDFENFEEQNYFSSLNLKNIYLIISSNYYMYIISLKKE